MNILQSFDTNVKKVWDREKDVTVVHGLLVKGIQNWTTEDTTLFLSYPEDVIKQAMEEFDQNELESAYYEDTSI